MASTQPPVSYSVGGYLLSWSSSATSMAMASWMSSPEAPPGQQRHVVHPGFGQRRRCTFCCCAASPAAMAPTQRHPVTSTCDGKVDLLVSKQRLRALVPPGNGAGRVSRWPDRFQAGARAAPRSSAPTGNGDGKARSGGRETSGSAASQYCSATAPAARHAARMNTVGKSPTALAAAGVNGDGKQDLSGHQPRHQQPPACFWAMAMARSSRRRTTPPGQPKRRSSRRISTAIQSRTWRCGELRQRQRDRATSTAERVLRPPRAIRSASIPRRWWSVTERRWPTGSRGQQHRQRQRLFVLQSGDHGRHLRHGQQRRVVGVSRWPWSAATSTAMASRIWCDRELDSNSLSILLGQGIRSLLRRRCRRRSAPSPARSFGR